MTGVLALALERLALSRGTVPSAVPVGHVSEAGTNGTRGTLGTAGTRGTVSAANLDGEPIDATAIDAQALPAAIAARETADGRASVLAASTVRRQATGQQQQEPQGSTAQDYDERAAISEFDGGLSRDHAEQLAALETMPCPDGVTEEQRNVIIDAAARFRDRQKRPH